MTTEEIVKLLGGMMVMEIPDFLKSVLVKVGLLVEEKKPINIRTLLKLEQGHLRFSF